MPDRARLPGAAETSADRVARHGQAPPDGGGRRRAPPEAGGHGHTGPAGEQPLADRRLVGPAVAAWSSAACCLGLPSHGALAVGGLLLVGAVVGVRGHRHLVALVLVAAAAAALAAGLRVAHSQAGLVPALAADGVVVEAEVTLAGDPRIVDSAFDEQVVVEADAVTVTGRGTTVDGRAPVLLLAGTETGVAELALGTTVRVVARLAPSDSADLAALLLVSRVEDVSSDPAWWWTVAGGVRAGVDRATADHGQPGELVPGLVVGDDSGLSTETTEEFRTSGLTHLLAVSGTNLTLVLGALLLGARLVGVRGRGLVVVGVLGAVGFVLLARPEPSVVRAAAMGLVALAGLTSGDRRRGLRALCVAVLVLVLLDPWLSRSVGFALSALATAAILVIAPPWRDALARWLPRWAAEAVAVPMAAQLACTPLVAAISGQASLVAVLANVLVAPAVGPATVLGLVAGLAEVAWMPLGRLVGWLAVLPAGWVVAVASVAAGLPGAAVEWGTSATALVVLTLVCAALGLGARWLLRRRWLSLSVAALLMVTVLRPLPSPGWPPDGWVLVACDVGQGDALVVATGGDTALVVDVGPDPTAVRGCLSDLDVRSVSAVLLTHLHADHVDGLAGVLDAVPVGEVQVSPVRSPSDAWADVELLAGAAGVPVRTVAAGSTGAFGAADWQVLSPSATTDPATTDDGGGEGSAVNDASLVLAVEVGGVRLLLTGDVEPAGQVELVRAGADLAADVLKVPHHGSAGQDAGFLEAVDPALAVVSVGTDNTYGHPAPGLLTLLEAGGADVARTDVDGDVAVVSDGDDVTWTTR